MGPSSKSLPKATAGSGSTASTAAGPGSRKRKTALGREQLDDSDNAALKAQGTPKSVAKPSSSKRLKKSQIHSVSDATKSEPSRLPILQKAPTQVLAVLAFGNGELGELGLGPKTKEALRPHLNPYLDTDRAEAFHVVQLDCGGVHVVALTSDNRIVTWGVNDKGALGRDTNWEGGLRDIDAEGSDDDDDEDLNPFESTPTEIPSNCFPAVTRFVQVAAGDSCSFALTEDGFVYGWGTFLVSNIVIACYEILLI